MHRAGILQEIHASKQEYIGIANKSKNKKKIKKKKKKKDRTRINVKDPQVNVKYFVVFPQLQITKCSLKHVTRSK